LSSTAPVKKKPPVYNLSKKKSLQTKRKTAIKISDSNPVEELLWETRTYFENLLNCANAPIIVWDPVFRINKFNRAFERLTGYTADEIIGRKLDILFPKESRNNSLAKIAKTLCGEHWESVEIPIHCKDGSIRLILWNSANIYDPSGKALVATIAQGQDITERKQIEDRLKESEEKYRGIVENTTNVIMAIKADGIISYLSPTSKTVLGYSPEDLIGTNPDIFHPDDMEKAQQAFSRALKGEKGSNYEYRILTKKGETKWISHSWSPIILDGKLQTVVSVIEDITQRKKADEKIQKLNESLQKHSIELASANKELEAFSYSASHDLRTPLRAIDGFSQALLEDYGDALDEQGKDFIQRIRKAIQKMGQLIDDMLRLSRLTRTEIGSEKIDFTSLARVVIEKLQRTEPSRKVKIKIQEGMIVKGDKKLLEILLDNLLGNAWKFTAKTKHPSIEVSSTIKHNQTVYIIKDNGAGFDMAHCDKLFVLFQRLHSTDEFSGTGIGLAIVQRIIYKHGGKIWAEGEIEKGATFFFTLEN
jgi:PAS domain S-box-containing protein